jgi:hypothetical protein
MEAQLFGPGVLRILHCAWIVIVWSSVREPRLALS